MASASSTPAASATGAAVDVAPSAHVKGTAAFCRTCNELGHRTEWCVAHLHPHVILQMDTGKKRRFELIFEALAEEAKQIREKQAAEGSSSTMEWLPGEGLSVVPSVREPSLLFLRTPTPQRFMAFVQTTPLYARHYNSIFLADWNVRTKEQLMQRMIKESERITKEDAERAAANAGSNATAAGSAPAVPPAAPSSVSPYSCVFRLQTHPKTLRADLLALAKDPLRFSPHGCTHILFVVECYNKFFAGITVMAPEFMPHGHLALTPANVSSEEDGVLCRAHYKIEECFVMDAGLRARIRAGSKAVDIGASPGGWSDFLASQGCSVLAIDPGVVRCSSPLVKHVQKLVQEALPELQEFAASPSASTAAAAAASASIPSSGIDLIVCDMNVRPLEAVKLIRVVVSSVPMSPTARLILTAKETLQGRSKLLVVEAVEALGDFWCNFRVLHLLSNGKERTIIADFLPVDSPQERAELEAKVKRAQETRAREWEQHLAANPLTDEQKKQREERKEIKDKKKAEKLTANAAAATAAASSASSSAVAAPAASASSSCSSSVAPPARKGGVGAGLATASWWDHYFDQHVEVVDWYLPNEYALELLLQEIRRVCGIGNEESADGDSAVAAPPCSLGALRILQLGCGNSDITELLFRAGVRHMINIDFSAVCITRMQALALEKGWTDAAAGGSIAFLFQECDARALPFPAGSFDFVFDKGTMDCVVLESELGIEAGKAAVAEAWRVLRPGGVQVCFSLYPPAARAALWISVLSEEDGGESAAEKAELLEILTQTDNPPRSFHTKAWSEVRMIALDHAPLEMPNQPHTYLYIATKR